MFNGYGNNTITLVQIECSLIVRMTASERLGNILFDRKILQIQTVSSWNVPFSHLNILNPCGYADLQVLCNNRDMVICQQLVWMVQLSDCICLYKSAEFSHSCYVKSISESPNFSLLQRRGQFGAYS